jgi:hypothetical protein
MKARLDPEFIRALGGDRYVRGPQKEAAILLERAARVFSS